MKILFALILFIAPVHAEMAPFFQRSVRAYIERELDEHLTPFQQSVREYIEKELCG